jgi:hypothetical protein
MKILKDSKAFCTIKSTRDKDIWVHLYFKKSYSPVNLTEYIKNNYKLHENNTLSVLSSGTKGILLFALLLKIFTYAKNLVD